MEIIFSTTKLEKDCSNRDKLVRRYGPRRAELIRKRLDEFAIADNLRVMRFVPQARCHELKKDRAGQLSVDLDHPYRLIVVPANDPVPRLEDGGLDWAGVTAIMVLGVEDTHE